MLPALEALEALLRFYSASKKATYIELVKQTLLT